MSKTDFDNKLINFNKRITSKIIIIIFFLGRIYFTSNNGCQSTFVYQPTLDTLELKKIKVLIMFLVENQREYIIILYNYGIIIPLYTASLHSIKVSEYRIGIKFNKDPLAVGQNNYLTKIVNIYIDYDLDAWPRNLPNNFKFKNCLFGATSIVKNIVTTKICV